MNSGIKSYKDLIVWQKSHKLALDAYKLSQAVKKNALNYEIWRQCLSSAFSVPANIVEGYHSHKGKSYGYYLEIARGSAGETEYWLYVLKEVGDISTEEYKNFEEGYDEILKMLTSIVSKIRKL